MGAPDTIAAIASAPGRGAIGVIRISGPEVPRMAQQLLGFSPKPRHAHLANFKDENSNAIDQGLALYFPAPDSFTGEHVLELQGHGGTLVLDLVIKRLAALGCRLARPGEFSERAFLNGKMDIAQAEAVADLIDAGTAAAARAALRSLQGEFSARIHELQAQITELRSFSEAAIDFPDEELDLLSGAALQGRLDGIFKSFESILAAARQGALLTEGLNVVIAGKPNAGKSSLLNKIVGDEVAIVADQPGTTRDVLRQAIHLGGLPLNLIDTAGLRTALDAVEAEGVRRARGELKKADRVLYVLDAARDGSGDAAGATNDWREALMPLTPGTQVTLIVNKIDLTGEEARIDESSDPPRVFLSAKTGLGMALLTEHLKKSAGFADAESGALSARRRHLDALERAHRGALAAAQNFQAGLAFELFAEELRLSQRALGEITGEFTSEDLLAEIFGSFCIGK